MEKQMDFIEYPKALYLDGAHQIADDADAEAALRADGYDEWQADQDRLSAPAETGEANDRDALKARAAELGIEHAPNIKTDKLAALVASAQG